MNNKTKMTAIPKTQVTLTAKEVSKLMGLSLAKTYELTKRQDFPVIHVGKRLIIPTNSFLQWLETTANQQSV